MLLLCIGNVPFTPRSIDPAAEQTQFVDGFLMGFAKLFEILCSAIQHLFEIGPRSSHQPLLLLGVLLFRHGEQSLLLCHQSMTLCKVAGKGT